MKLLHIISILLLLAWMAQAEDLIFFADDHYKSIGRPELAACVVNPALLPGDWVLRINLANAGMLKEMMPINKSGSNEDILLEMRAEMRCCDALNINAALGDAGPIKVTTALQHIDNLPAGGAKVLQFNVTALKNASGWYALPFCIDYERQVDVSVKRGEAFPLYEAERQNLTANIFVAGSYEPLRISGIKSELHAGESGCLRAAICNDGAIMLHNCSAGLLAAPPLYIESPAAFLGNLAPGSLAVAAFTVHVDENAFLQDYQLGCEIDCQEKSITVPLTIPLTRAGDLAKWALLALGGLAMAGSAAFLLWKSGGQLSRHKRRRRKM
jgi:hypothetical protein